MDKVLFELEKRGLPYVVESTGADSLVLFAVGYTPFLYHDDEFEIGAFYPASHTAYTLAKTLAGDKFIPNPNENYKEIAERAGLGKRGANDLIFTPEFGSLCALGAIKIPNISYSFSREIPDLECENCGICKKTCPNNALNQGFNFSLCIRRQMDEGIEFGVEKLLGKSVLGCNKCSVFCPKNKKEKIRPPEIFQDTLKIDNFFEKALSGRRALSSLGDIIGHNMIRPAKMLTLATYSLQNLDEKYLIWLKELEKYPDERVKRAVDFIKTQKNYN